MIGQKRILDKLLSYILDSLPKTMLFVGDYGCGKHTLCKELSNHFNINLIDITNNISFDYISSLYKNARPTIYCINAIGLTDKKQNMILKFIEEPLDGSFVILLCESKTQLLDTICNRCYIVDFDKYTKNELQQIIPNFSDFENIPDIENLTPGKLLTITPKQFEDNLALAKKFILNINKATLPNTLTLLNKFNYKDEYDKLDVSLFFNNIKEETLNLITKEYNDLYYNINRETADFSKRIADSRINKETLMENYLVTIWLLAKGV